MCTYTQKKIDNGQQEWILAWHAPVSAASCSDTPIASSVSWNTTGMRTSAAGRKSGASGSTRVPVGAVGGVQGSREGLEKQRLVRASGCTCAPIGSGVLWGNQKRPW